MSIETTCAVCRLSDGLIINMIVATPSDLAPDGCQLVEVMNGQICDIGWYYVEGDFHGPTIYAMCNSSTNEIVSFFSASYISPEPVSPEGYFIIKIVKDMDYGIGWTWDGTKFNLPSI